MSEYQKHVYRRYLIQNSAYCWYHLYRVAKQAKVIFSGKKVRIMVAFGWCKCLKGEDMTTGQFVWEKRDLLA